MPKNIPLPQLYSLPIQSPQEIKNRAQLLRDIESGELEYILFDARVYRHGRNRNFLTFRAQDLPAFAPSFVQRPFLRDHNQRSIDARDGIILSSKLVGDEFHQRIKLTTRRGMTDYVEGRIDRFSIGWDWDWIMCTVCLTDWTTCTHWPGRKYHRPATVRGGQTDNGEVTCELCFMGPTGKETSAVNSNAVDGTGLLAVLETYKLQKPKPRNAAGKGVTMPQTKQDEMLFAPQETDLPPASGGKVPPASGGKVPPASGGKVPPTSGGKDPGARTDLHRDEQDPMVLAAEQALQDAEARLAADESLQAGTEDDKLARQRQAITNLLGAEQNARKIEANVERSNSMLLSISARLLSASLQASKLPRPAQEAIRKQFQARLDAGIGFEPTELEDAIAGMRSMLGEIMSGAMIQGPGRVNAIFNTDDSILAATADMFRVERDDHLKNVKPARLSGIRELYFMLTGDYGFHGGFFPEEVGLATTLDFSGLVKNALNKLVVAGWEQMGIAGYNWWEDVVLTEPFSSLQQITGVLIGTVSSLPVVEERGEYPELLVGDSPETGDWDKYGGYIPMTIEMIDRDETRKLRAYGLELGKAARRNISEQVAGIFTTNSHAGPTMADGGALFNATAVTTTGGHANLLTTALGADYTAWEAAAAAMFNQPMFTHESTPGTGKKLAVDPKFCLVPRALRAAANALFITRWASEVTAIPSAGAPEYAGIVVPKTVPEWPDTNNWAAVANPQVAPAIFVGHRFGLRPEIYTAGRETDPAVFMNDEHRIKVRHFLAVWVNDFRPLHKSNVA